MMEVKQPDDIFARRHQIGAPLDPKRYTAFRRLATDPAHRLVVAFGGGSAVGLSGNVALAEILEELELKSQVSMIWGTSAGAIVGGSWASGTPAKQMLPLVRAVQGSLDVCWLRLFTSLLLMPFGYPLPEGLIKGRRIAALIDEGLTVKSFEECSIPFRCIAISDDGQARRTVFEQGSLLPAIYASMSLPGIFMPRPPLPNEDCSHFDGGTVENTPLRSPISEHLRSGDGRKLLLLASHFGCHGHLMPLRGFIHRFFQTMDALGKLAWPYQLAEARNYPNVVLALLDPQIQVAKSLDFSLVEQHYLKAREAFRDLLQDTRLALSLARFVMLVADR